MSKEVKKVGKTQETIVRFDNVSFEWGVNKSILYGVSFTIRRGMKFTLMGQNGAGKSTIFGLISGIYKSENGIINIVNGVSIASALQVIPRDQLDLTVREFFARCFKNKVYNLDPKTDDVLEVVNLKNHGKVHAPNSSKSKAISNELQSLGNRVIKTFSGGQQARLLLASALIQD